jgi:putative peptidoglycan lipid II flippase
MEPAKQERQSDAGPALGRTALLVGVLNALGMAMGFARDLLIARYFGASADTDAFMIAWTIPETVTPLIMEGAMLYALVPIFARSLVRDGTLRPMVDRSIAPVLGVLVIAALVIGAAAPVLVGALAPGLVASDLAVTGFRITSLTVVFLGLSGYLTAVLNTQYVFGVCAAVFVAYNTGIIISIVTLHEVVGVTSAAIGLVVGSALMVAIQVPSFLRRVGLPRPSFKFSRSLLTGIAPAVPVMLFMIVRHSQVYVERFFGSFLEAGAISHLNYAQKVAQVPVTLALTIAIVSFPALARGANRADRTELGRTVDRNLRIVTMLVAPAVAYLALFAPQVIELLFERGAFTAEDTALTSGVLSVYVLGRIAQALVTVAVLPMFIFSETIRTPLRAATLGLIVTIVVDLVLLPWGAAVALAAGNSIGIAAMAWMLLHDLNKRVLPVDLRALVRHVASTGVLAAVAAGLGMMVTWPLLAPGFTSIVVGGIVTVLVYATAGQWFGIVDVREALGPVIRRRAKATAKGARS